MVHLGDEGDAPALETLDDPHLPQRPGAVEWLGGDLHGEHGERGVVTGGRQRSTADVLVEVEHGVVDHHGWWSWSGAG